MFDQSNTHSDDMATTSGASSRLPALRRDIDSNINNTHILDMTPSGEVQMRVINSGSQQGISSDTSLAHTDESLNMQKLQQELVKHREAERRIMGLLESHSDENHRQLSFWVILWRGDSLMNENRQNSLRGQSDQCNGPSINSPWKAHPNTRVGGCGAVQVDRNRCVDTMTTPDRRNTIVGNGTNNVSSYPMLPINSNTSSHPVPQSNNISKAKKPPTFDGNTGWQNYLVQFEMVAAVNNWDDHTKAYELATNLRGVAQGIVTEIEPLKRFDYTYLVSALTSRFEPVNQENMYKVQMNSYYRKSGQTLPEMGQDIRRITRLAYPTAPVDIRNQLGKDCFIGNFKVTHKFTIANIDVPAVIGYDFLHQYECTLELGKGVLIIGQNYIHCIKESQIESVFKVSITEKLTIPPNTEVITSCAIKGDASSIMNAMTQVLPSKHTDNL
ncbi:unnamed protein product [Mytilus coruscus]|uniref:Uncharacterized protein n=1 Tax=Mytilus coruscus TaxID=42192 RepID=A0A6J8BII1_MYTCO|nr:unnamed protein product [Mytilus coruscus]